MDERHDLIAALKALAVDLGRTPLRREFERHVASGGPKLERLFRNYGLFLKAAGLETYDERRRPKPLGKEIFETDIETRVETFTPRESVQPKEFPLTLVIGDTHFPFASQPVLDAIYEWTEKNKPFRIIQIGDLTDQYSWSKFPKSVNLYTPNEEQELARKQAILMWTTLQKAAPQAECVQLLGNHDLRALKQTLAHLPALEQVVKKYLEDILTFPNVKLISDERQEYIVDGIAFIHGHKPGLGSHRDYMQMNVVCGHTHLAGVSYRRIRGQTLFELNAGFVGDPESKAFSYTPGKIVQWTPGFGVIWPWGPAFVPV